ncbi:MAG: HAMP domain-containing histidine kinase [Bacteroides sp.]|nr:HAMP domain-containing histidine kinase [Bacteroidales bacterium]MBD5379418.1 HAMP domain-containing histidine kinase [Bacteroides sp.]MDE5809408.1 HAMP domain-containing histidine kinase [Muribaculaceae bacterium]
MIRFTIISVIIALASTVTLKAQTLSIEEKRRITNHLLNELSQAKSPRDSIDILYNIFDVAHRNQAREIGMKIFDVAGRLGDNHIQNDIIAQTSAISTRQDSIQEMLMRKAQTLPDDEERKATIAYIKMNQIRNKSRNINDETRLKELKSLMTELSDSKPSDIYEQINLIYSICCLLGESANPALTIHYFNDLLNIVEKLPQTAYFIANTVYTRGSTLLTETGDYKRALELDEKLLDIINNLEQKYHSQGRIYRNYDATRYARYMCKLYNYPVMTPHEVEDAYEKVKYYAERDSDALLTFKEYQTPTICYLMAYKRYNEVVPMLIKQIPQPYNQSNQRRFYRYLLEASDSIQNLEAYHYAAKNYIKYLEQYLEQRDYEKYRELQIMYDVYDLQSANNTLEIKSKKAEVKHQRSIIISSIIALLVLIIFLIILLRLYRKARNFSINLIEANDALIEESSNLMAIRDELERSRDQAREANLRSRDIISNISNEVKVPLQAISEYSRLIVDCIDQNKQPFLSKYADLVESNSEILNRVIDDVMSLSELDSNQMAINYFGANVNEMCEIAVSSMAHRVNNDIDLEFIPGDPELTVSTDPRRVEQVLISLLSNAAKFTEKGSIKLSYIVDQTNNRIVFIIKDTGIGIPADKAEVIFDRFVKLDRNTQGPGLGLTIDRMIARLLGGDIRLDTTYSRGACFRFFIPIAR